MIVSKLRVVYIANGLEETNEWREKRNIINKYQIVLWEGSDRANGTTIKCNNIDINSMRNQQIVYAFRRRTFDMLFFLKGGVIKKILSIFAFATNTKYRFAIMYENVERP